MAELKTQPTTQNPKDFLKTISSEQKKADSTTLLELFTKITGEKPVMWGTSIIGFGTYHYTSERSTQEGDWPLVAFSPRKQNISLYIMQGNADNVPLLEALGKHKKSVGCLYINKLSDVDVTVLAKLIENAYEHMRALYPSTLS